jgi:hypothetical protein
MSGRLWVCLAAAGLVAATGTARAQSSGNESAAQNVRESQQYENLLCSNPGFRAKRIAQECGPVTDPQLHQSCLASFQCNRPPRKTHPRRAPPSETIR